MSWGDVWVCADSVRPAIGPDGPQGSWIPAGFISRDDRNFVEATHQMRSSRRGNARAVDFTVHLTSKDVGRSRDNGDRSMATFDPDGLWVAVELTPHGGDDGGAEPRYAVFAQRVFAVTSSRRAPAPTSAAAAGRRAHTSMVVRARAKSQAGPLEWGYRALPS